jgi:hypothetical protein
MGAVIAIDPPPVLWTKPHMPARWGSVLALLGLFYVRNFVRDAQTSSFLLAVNRI